MLVLRAERLRRGWSLIHVCSLTKISPSDLSAIEREHQRCYAGWKTRIAAAFALDASYLFARDEQATADALERSA